MKNNYQYVVYINKENGDGIPVVLFKGEDITDFQIQTGMFQPGYLITIEYEKI